MQVLAASFFDFHFDSNELFISGNLEKVDETTFKKTLYNNVNGTYNTDYYTWDGTQFILQELN
ncbi:hypothetical protein EPK97_14680 [Chengkuizengella sediminis]|nr:hypothetical protein [Chengkuizengella sediminis]